MKKIKYNIGIYAPSGQLIDTYEVEAFSIENARELAWDLFIQNAWAEEIK